MRPMVRHVKCTKAKKGQINPRMVEDEEGAKVFISLKGELIVRVPYVCPACGWVVTVDFSIS